MSDKVTKALFQFRDYQIKKFNYTDQDGDEPVTINFKPSGTYDSIKGEFMVYLECQGLLENNEKTIFNIELTAAFEFDKGCSYENIPDYFYPNSIAIVFPYLRAFVSTLTLQANTRKLMILDLMNLSQLGEPLKQNTEQIK